MLADGHDLLADGRHALAAQVGQHRVAEGVVHHSVQPPAPQVGAAHAERFLGRGVLPHFPDEQLVLAVGLDGLADLFNKGIRQFVGHIQPETRRSQV